MKLIGGFWVIIVNLSSDMFLVLPFSNVCGGGQRRKGPREQKEGGMGGKCRQERNVVAIKYFRFLFDTSNNNNNNNTFYFTAPFMSLKDALQFKTGANK